MKKREKRYYDISETVFIKPSKSFGKIVDLNINPDQKIYKATIEEEVDGKTVTNDYDLWEITKDNRKKSNREPVRIGLNKPYYKVREFHEAFGHPVADKPTMMSSVSRAKSRVDWTVDEVSREFLEAENVVDQADAVMDGIYFLLGTLVEMGVEPEPIFNIVQNANMGKLHEDGKPRYREDGKIQKPDGWHENFAPENKIKEEIDRQSNES